MRQATLLPVPRLRAVRMAIGMTQAELARRVGVSAPLLSRVERGEARAWPRLRRTTAEALGIPEDVLYGETR